MIAYRKVPAGTTVEVVGRTISPIDRFGTFEVNLDQPGSTTKPVKMDSVAYVQDCRGTCCPPVKRWSNGISRSSSTKRKLLWDSRGRGRLFLTSALARNCFLQNM